ncbi:MAG: RnfABCDGE type electron transport complex subunit G, partial [Kiritimatiellae bacterium]|nr:RnfABCDGE type electron transport complex subunit G [Kiritimatiellia bacterium]
FNVTKQPIKDAQQRKQTEAIKKVIPACDNNPAENKLIVTNDENECTFYVARKNGEYAGAAFEVTTSEGYAGDITIMMGIATDDTISGLAILKHAETPGLGAHIKDDNFPDRFTGSNINTTTWSVKKDGGDIDAITAATISSRAVVSAFKDGKDLYLKFKEQIIFTGAKQ